MKVLSALCVSLGIILLVSAFAYPRTVKPDWTEEQAMERIEAGFAVHGSCHSHARGEKCDNQSICRYEKIQAEMIEARERPRRIASILRWLGVGATVLGVGVYYATRERE